MFLLFFKHKDNEVLLVLVYITVINQYCISYIPSPLHELEVKSMCIFAYASVKKSQNTHTQKLTKIRFPPNDL